MKKIVCIVITLLLGGSLFAQNKLLTMEEAVLGQRGKLAPQRIVGLSWVKNTSDFSFIKTENNKEILVRGDINNNQKDILTIDELNSILKTIEIDEQKRFPTIKWLGNSSFKCTIAQKLVQIDIEKKEATVIAVLADKSSNQEIHPITKNIAFTIDNRLLLNISGKSTRVIHDGDYGLVNGQAVHRNEFGIQKGIFWNNSGSALAYYHMNETMVTDYPIIDNNETPAKANMIKYPMAGDKSHEVSVYIYNVANNQKLVLNTGDPKDQYLTNIAWSPDDKHVYIAHVNREQNQMKLNKYDAHFGNLIETVLEEKNEKYVEPENPVLFVPENPNQFVWQSERDGFNHLYLYDIHGKLIKQLTKGNWIVTQVHGFDKKGDKALFQRLPKKSYTERHLYSVEIKIWREMKKLTEGEGTHTLDLNIEAGYFIDNYSSVTIPRIISIYSLDAKKQTELLKAPNPLAEYNMPKMELVKLKNDMGPELQGRIIYPSKFR
jgi:dipeptidyl-peptidase 4